MTEQQLDGAKVGAGFQQMHREGMAQRMRRDRFGETALLTHLSADLLHGHGRDRPRWRIAREQPFSWMGTLPVIAKHVRQFGRPYDRGVLAPLALFHTDDHPLAVDRAGFEADRFGYAQPTRVTNGQDHTVLQVINRAQETSHFILAQYDGKLLWLARGGNLQLEVPIPPEVDFVKEAKRRHRYQN